MEFYNVENGELRDTGIEGKDKAGNKLPANIVAVLSDAFKMQLDSQWKANEMSLDKAVSNLTSMNKTADKISSGMEGLGIGDLAGNNPNAYKAGPYSSLKYGGVDNIKFHLKFTAYADNKMTGKELTRPLDCFFYLMLTQLPKDGRGAIEALAKQATNTITGAVDAVAQKVINLADNITAGNLGGSFMSIIDLDKDYARMNTNPGNWIAKITVSDILSGWFVINSVSATFSKERYWDNQPLYIGFDVQVKSYMIPDKAGISNGREEIVRPVGSDPDGFAKMYIMNQRNDLKQLQANMKSIGNQWATSATKNTNESPA
jgi:hypothetical protein